MAFQYKYYILAVANITSSCFGSSSRASTNAIVTNYVYVNSSDVASIVVKVSTISFLYLDIQIPIHTSYNMDLLKQT